MRFSNNFRRILLLGLIAAPLLLLAYAGSERILKVRATTRAAPRSIDLKALGNFNFDQANGNIWDIPSKFRELDGQRVAIDGFMWSPTGQVRVNQFQIIYNFVMEHHRAPLVQERVFASCPPGKTVPYTDSYLRFVGVLHTDVQKQDGVITSVFTMDVEQIERL